MDVNDQCQLPSGSEGYYPPKSSSVHDSRSLVQAESSHLGRFSTPYAGMCSTPCKHLDISFQGSLLRDPGDVLRNLLGWYSTIILSLHNAVSECTTRLWTYRA